MYEPKKLPGIQNARELRIQTVRELKRTKTFVHTTRSPNTTKSIHSTKISLKRSKTVGVKDNYYVKGFNQKNMPERQNSLRQDYQKNLQKINNLETMIKFKKKSYLDFDKYSKSPRKNRIYKGLNITGNGKNKSLKNSMKKLNINYDQDNLLIKNFLINQEQKISEYKKNLTIKIQPNQTPFKQNPKLQNKDLNSEYFAKYRQKYIKVIKDKSPKRKNKKLTLPKRFIANEKVSLGQFNKKFRTTFNSYRYKSPNKYLKNYKRDWSIMKTEIAKKTEKQFMLANSGKPVLKKLYKLGCIRKRYKSIEPHQKSKLQLYGISKDNQNSISTKKSRRRFQKTANNFHQQGKEGKYPMYSPKRNSSSSFYRPQQQDNSRVYSKSQTRKINKRYLKYQKRLKLNYAALTSR